MTEWLGWHFLSENRRLRYSPYTLVNPGQTLLVDPPLVLCERGLHASKRAIDALGYAPGPVVCRVRLSGEIIEEKDKACATERTVLWMADATRVLHEFACWCAEQALLGERKAGREPDSRSWEAIKAKRAWLHGEITNEELQTARAAGNAARAAAEAAAEPAAKAAAKAAVYAAIYAAETAAETAAKAAAWTAAQTAVWVTGDAARAVGNVACSAQNTKLEEMLWAFSPN